MQNNYYFLRNLTSQLHNRIIGWQFFECYSQNKDEVIFELQDKNKKTEFFIRAMLRPDFCCLSFPDHLHRAKRNSADLFPEIIGKSIEDIVQFENERAFLLKLTDDVSLLFKMHGNRSNIVLYKNEHPLSLFNSRLQNDWDILISDLDRPIAQGYNDFVEAEGDENILFPTFGKEIKKYLKKRNYQELDLEEKWKVLQELLEELNDGKYYIVNDALPEFLLFREGEVWKEFDDPLAAVSAFYVNYLSLKQFLSAKSAVVKRLTDEIKKDKAYIKSTSEKLSQLESESSYKQWADLLMANLHVINKGDKEAVVQDFYNEGREISIKLNRQLTPQKNAERFYQKSKNQHKEMEVHLKGLMQREEQLEARQQKLDKINSVSSLKELREIAPDGKKQEKEKDKKLPYHYFDIAGYDVLVGKSARHNDVLLQQHSRKDDLWLHARDAAGSHVIIKNKGNDRTPADVIHKAAQLAAYNSKRKNESLCPVIVTERKFVRKRKGDPPGAVVVDREEVIMVKPTLDI